MPSQWLSLESAILQLNMINSSSAGNWEMDPGCSFKSLVVHEINVISIALFHGRCPKESEGYPDAQKTPCRAAHPAVAIATTYPEPDLLVHVSSAVLSLHTPTSIDLVSSPVLSSSSSLPVPLPLSRCDHLFVGHASLVFS
jgi:hypothetical protein